MPTDQRYQTPAAFRTAIDARLKTKAKRDGRPFPELRREFLYQRFLARVFHDDSPWVLKGGVGVLARLPGARHSRDIDLLHLTMDPAGAEQELRTLGRRDLGDHLHFQVVRSVALSVEDALKLKIDAYVGASKWENFDFDIDISCERHFVASCETIQPQPVLDTVGLAPLPPFRLYPLVDQIADKVVAMFETHGGAPSNRYRDLVDLALLITLEGIDAELLQQALAARTRHARNPVVTPRAIHSPGTAWAAGYHAEARRSTLPTDLHQLAAALVRVGACLNPVLDGTVASGTWNPTTRTWG